MQGKIIELAVEPASTRIYRKNFVNEWSIVELAIDEVFSNGGEVKLQTMARVPREHPHYERNAYYDFDEVLMRALPGKYILVIFPEMQPPETRLMSREWRYSSFNGESEMVIFDSEHIYDERLVCTDVTVAKEIFEEFFNAREITQKMNDLTVSEWDPL